jgi:hypothetical protein
MSRIDAGSEPHRAEETRSAERESSALLRWLAVFVIDDPSTSLSSRTSAEFSPCRAQSGRNPHVKMVNTIASKIGVYSSSKGQLMKTF